MRGYYRRRGWMVWHGAVLPRAEKFPALHELTGESAPAPAREQNSEQLVHNLKLWKAVLGSGGAAVAG